MPITDLPPICKWENVTQIRGAVHIVHGLAEHPERYERLAHALNGAGLIVWAHHQRGHGLNPVPGIKGHFGDQGGWQALADDAWAVSKQLLTERSGISLIMFAHSMGSFVGQRVLVEHGVSYTAAIFSGTDGPPTIKEGVARAIARVQRLALGKRGPGVWLQKMVIEDTYNAEFGRNAPPNTWLSRDAEEVSKYNRDPQCGFPLTAQAWLDLLEGRASQSTVEFFSAIPNALPLRIIFGTDDPVGENGRGVARLLKILSDAGLNRITSQPYQGARHELVNETNRDQITADLIEWIHTVVSQR
jgi:alpha-beta hydrolase superfamily lysophospholipase